MKKFLWWHLTSVVLFIATLSLDAMDHSVLNAPKSFCRVKSIFEQGCDCLAPTLSPEELCKKFSFWLPLRPEFAFMLLVKRIQMTPATEIKSVGGLLNQYSWSELMIPATAFSVLSKSLTMDSTKTEHQRELFRHIYTLALNCYEHGETLEKEAAMQKKIVLKEVDYKKAAHKIVLTLQQENLFFEKEFEDKEFKTEIQKHKEAHTALLQEIKERKSQWAKFERWVGESQAMLGLPSLDEAAERAVKKECVTEFAELKLSLEFLLNDPEKRGALNRCIIGCELNGGISKTLTLLEIILECPSYTSLPENLAPLINQQYKEGPSFFHTMLRLDLWPDSEERQLFEPLSSGLTIFELLLNKGADLTLRDIGGNTVLHDLACRKDISGKKGSLVKKTLNLVLSWLEDNLNPQEYESFLNCPNKMGRTALYY
jgi:hypothetical protein